MKLMKQKKFLLGIIVALLILCCGMNFSNSIPAKVKAVEPAVGLKFSLVNNSAEYSVSAADKTITEAIIPATYNGLPVTEIAANGFAACTKLKTVVLSPNIRRVGMSAFMNCSVLETVNMTAVKEIAQNAFAMCPNLDKLILPASLENVGATILRNNPNTVTVRADEETVATWSSTWKTSFAGTFNYSPTDIVYDDVIENGELKGYSIILWQGLNDGNASIIIPTQRNELPVLNIAPYAFAFSDIASLTVPLSSHNINIQSGAFYFMKADFVILNNSVTFIDEDVTWRDVKHSDDVGISANVFAFSDIPTVILPDTMTNIGAYMFQASTVSHINSVSSYIEDKCILPQNIIRIGEQSFADCTSIEHIFISENIESMGENAFDGWPNGNIAEFNLTHEPEAWQSLNWCDNKENVVRWQSLKITFNANRADAMPVQFIREISYNETLTDIVNMVVPTSEQYEFDGWFFDSACTIPVYSPYQFQQNTTLYANWTEKPVSVTFAENECVTFNILSQPPSTLIDGKYYIAYGGALSFTVTVDADYDVSTLILKVGNTIIEPEYGVYILTNITGNITVEVSSISRIPYTITYNANSGSGSMTSSQHNYGVSSNLSPNTFTKSGYTFAGWDTNPSATTVVYLNEASVSDLGSTTLYAVWSYKITYNANSGSGSMSASTFIYGVPSTLTTNNYTKNYYNFYGWNTNTSMTGTSYSNGQSVSNLGNTTLYAVWSYTISYKANGGSGSMTSTTHFYNVAFSLKSCSFYRSNYDFDGWSLTSSGSVWYYDEEYVVNVADTAKTASVSLHAKWSLIIVTYQVEYHLYGGTNHPDNPSTYNSNQSITLKPPKKDGSDFEGWYKEVGFLNKITVLSGGITQVYSKWTPRKYLVDYKANNYVTYPSSPTLIYGGETLTFYVNVNAAYNKSTPTIYVNDQLVQPAATPGLMAIHPSYTSYTYIVTNVTSNLTITAGELPVNNYSLYFMTNAYAMYIPSSAATIRLDDDYSIYIPSLGQTAYGSLYTSLRHGGTFTLRGYYLRGSLPAGAQLKMSINGSVQDITYSFTPSRDTEVSFVLYYPSIGYSIDYFDYLSSLPEEDTNTIMLIIPDGDSYQIIYLNSEEEH